MFSSFFRFAIGFILILFLGIGGLALSSRAAPFFEGVKASVVEAFK